MKALHQGAGPCLTVLVLSTAGAAIAGDYGTAREAGAMLDKVVGVMEADPDKALAMFDSGEGGFRDRDLYPYCVGADGKFSAHPTLAGTGATRLIDKTGDLIGQKVMTLAKQGEVSEVE